MITLAGFFLHWVLDGHSFRSLVSFFVLFALMAIPA